MEEKTVRDKYKQLKYQHLKRIYEKNLAKLPLNCRYNKQIQLPNKVQVNICSFNLDDSYAVDLCYKKEHSQACNAFCPRRMKEELYAEFMAALKDDQIRATYYKDINVLYWLYPSLNWEEFPDKKTFFHKVKVWFKVLF